jgi:hypothetical protein
MVNNVAEKIYYNRDLMDLIYQFDYTYIKKHKLLFKESLNLILEKSHYFWYDKYEKSLSYNCNMKSIFEYQDAFFDTLEQLSIFY